MGDMQQYEQLILALMSADNDVRGQAEEAYNAAKASPDQLLPVLIHLLSASQNEQVRSLCAVLLRKAVMQQLKETDGRVAGLSPEAIALVKTQLLVCVEREPQRHIQKKVCDAIGQLAINLLNTDINAWPELGPFILGATGGSNPQLHEAAFTILNTLAEFIAEKWTQWHGQLLQVFRSSLGVNQDLQVRNAALRALASFLMELDDAKARQPFQELVPLMLQTIAAALDANAEDECRDAIEIFVELADSQIKFLKRDLEACITAMITIASNAQLEDSVRHLALEFLLTVAESAPTLARKLPDFCGRAVPVALQMMLEIECDTADELREWEEEDDEEEETEINNYDVGEEALDRLAIAMGGKTMMPVLSGKIQEWFLSDNWKERHAALMAISQSGEGCAAQMAKQLEMIVKTIVTKFGDVHPRVRWAAINTIGQMSTDFGPKLQKKLHATVLPALLAAMDDQSRRVQAHAAAAVINFCEHCERATLQPYLPNLLGKLRLLLTSDGQRRVQEQAVTAVASVADVAEADFTPFYDDFMPPLKFFLQQAADSKEYRMLRGKAMECISLIGVAVGKEKFGADAQAVMEMLIQTRGAELEADDPQVAFMLQACARICKCLGEQFKPYLPYVIPPLLESAQIDPELHVTDAEEDEEEEEEEGMESVTVAIRGQGNKRITIRTSALEEKATACSMLHSYVMDLKEGFFPYVQDVARILVPLIKFQYMDDVRTAAMMTMPVLLESAILAVNAAVPGATEQLVHELKEFMFEPVLEQLKNEPDVETLSCMLESLGELLAHGSTCAAAQLSELQLRSAAAVLKGLLQESIDRRDERRLEREDDEPPDEEELEQLEGVAEREEGLVSSLVECVGGLFKVYGPAFMPIFLDENAQPAPDEDGRIQQPTLGHWFFQLLQPTRADGTPTPASDRTAAICVFDDVIEHCSAAGVSDKYIPSLYTALLQYSVDPSTEVRQAAVYGIGLLAQHVNDGVFTLQMQEQAAQTMLTVSSAADAFEEEKASATDNAVSALGKICRRSEPIAAVAMPRWLNMLPLKADKAEACAVHKLLVELVEASHAQLLGAQHERLPQVLCVFGQLLNTDLIDEDLNPRIVSLLKQVYQGLPHVLQQLPSHPSFQLLTVEQRQLLESAISS
uniref:TOG domain-containing protein n=1 Tax=Calcidiscus leptoporus TaxID=127549 RepID=A0A7S0J6U6_9EUKA